MKPWVLLVIGVFSFALMGDSCSGGAATSSSPAAPDNGSATANASATTKAPQVLLDLTGSGTKQTQKFSAGGDWDLEWSYDCSNFGAQGNFVVEVYNGDGSISFENSAVNQLGNKGQDVQHYHKGGTFYLDISSECNWHLTAKG